MGSNNIQKTNDEMKDSSEKRVKSLNVFDNKMRSTDAASKKNSSVQMKENVVSERPKSMLELIRSKMGGANSK